MKDNNKQHYVPQYYLKNFSNNGHIHIYDLKNKKAFTNSISNVAHKKKFYNVDVAFFRKIIENEIFENEDFIDNLINKHNESILAPFFDSFNPARDRIINNDDRETITIIDFYSLVDFILVQTYRNPKLQFYFGKIQQHILSEHKEFGGIRFDKIERGIVLLLLLNELHYGRKTQLRKEVTEGHLPIINEIKTIKELVTNSYKIIYWNLTDIDFLTSDFAMAHMRLKPEDRFSTIFVPINTKIGILLINKKSSTWNQKVTDTSSFIKIGNIDKLQVEVFNRSIIERANRFIYSINGTFPKGIESIEYKEWWNIE